MNWGQVWRRYCIGKMAGDGLVTSLNTHHEIAFEEEFNDIGNLAVLWIETKWDGSALDSRLGNG